MELIGGSTMDVSYNNYSNFSTPLVVFSSSDGYFETKSNLACGSRNILLVLKSIFCISAVFGNGLVILSVWKFPAMRTVDNILICNLAVSSIFVCTHILTDIINLTFDIVDTSLKYICLAKTMDTLIVLLSSVFNLLLMSIERYIAILHPLRFRSIVTHRRIKITLVICWVFYLAFACLPLVGINTFDMPDLGYANSEDPSGCNFHVVMVKFYGKALLMILLVATTANLGLFIRVLFVVYTSNRKQIPDKHTHKSSNKKTLTVLLTLCFFILSWLPFVLAAAIKASAANIIDLCIVASPYNIGLLYSSFNWLIYGLMRPKFRRCFSAILTCTPVQTQSSRWQSDPSTSSTAMLRRP